MENKNTTVSYYVKDIFDSEKAIQYLNDYNYVKDMFDT